MKRSVHQLPRPAIAPSLLASDFAHLADEIHRAQDAGADLLHVDVMDGHLVPNITIGPVVVEKVRAVTDLLLDVHLMISEPERYIQAFAEAGINIEMINQGASEVSMMFGLKAADAGRAVRALYDAFFQPA